MTKARDLANIISGGFTVDDLPTLTANEIPNLDAAKITSGTFADARIAASNVSQHATSFDDNKIVNDISTLAIRQASNENKSAYNTNSMYVDVFQDATGITNLTNSTRNSSEYVSSSSESSAYETGDRESSYTITLGSLSASNDINPNSGSDVGNWLNGNISTGYTNAWVWNHTGSNFDGATITFDLGLGNSKIYTGAKFHQDANDSSGNWAFLGSNDNSSFTNLSGTFAWGGAGMTGSGTDYTQEISWTNTTAYRYLRLEGQSGAQSNDSAWQEELEFKVQTGTYNATGSFESNAITAPSSTNKMGAIITYQDQAGTNALNTDIVLKLSADGGSNYTTATMTAMPDFASGIKMAKVNDLSVTAGTSLKYKIEFANQASGSKEARIRGVSLQY